MATITLLKIVEDALKGMLTKVARVQDVRDLSAVLNEVRRELKEYVANKIIREYNKGCRSKLLTVRNLVEEMIEACRSIGLSVLVIDARLRSVGAIGLSYGILHGVFEIGLSWDHLLDVPFIPGSSIKGAIRSLMLSNCVNTKDKRTCVELTLKLLGSAQELSPEERNFIKEYIGVDPESLDLEAASSHVRILDAYPVECGELGLLEEWIMTPHYKGEVVDEYNVSPTPLLHLVVARGTVFRFVVALDEIAREIASRYVELFTGRRIDGVSAFAKIFIDTLSEGVGARTSKGYNVFEIVRAHLYGSRPCR